MPLGLVYGDEAGKSVFFAQHHGTDLTGIKTGAGVAATTCRDAGEDCRGAPLPRALSWLQVFGLRDPDFQFGNLTLEEFYSVLRSGKEFFDRYVGSTNVNLSQFREAGGKLITYHGLVCSRTAPAKLSDASRVNFLIGRSDDSFRLNARLLQKGYGF
jgi:hypothetical protein